MQRRAFLNTMGSAVLQAGAALAIRDALRGKENKPAEALASDEDFWRRVRHAYTIDRNINNLNSGSVSPAPKTVQGAMNRYWEITNMQPALYVDELLLPQAEEVRRRLAEEFGCSAGELALTRNTTEGLNIVLNGLEFQPGDEILTTTQEHIAVKYPLSRLERRLGVIIKKIPFQTPPPSLDYLHERIVEAITPRTRLIVFCHITYTTGQIFPVKKICQTARHRGIETLVDGAHSFAQFPFRRDDLGCDYYATSLHKWLNAPVGTGFLYVSRDKIEKLWPLMGGSGDATADIRKFEQTGTRPVAMQSAITEALTFLDGIGIKRKAARLRYLRRRWAERLAALSGVSILNNDDPAQTCGIGAFSLNGWDAGKLTDLLLNKHRIFVRPRYIPDEFTCIRVTPNIFSTIEEIDHFSRVVERIARRV